MPKEVDLPTMPTSMPDSASDEIIWLVSYDEDDDREMTRPQIAAALTRGEIDRETIVWRDGLEDWVAIGDIPSLARLVPAGGDTDTNAVGATASLGFLGTGLKLDAGGTGAARKSIPPPLPGAGKQGTAGAERRSNPPPFPKRSSRPPPAPVDDEEEPLSLDPESIEAVSSSDLLPGKEPSPTLPRARALSGGTFGVSGKIRDSAGRSDASEESASQPQSGEESPDSEPPSSGTPSLNALAAAGERPSREIEAEILALGTAPSSLGLHAPPTIDVSDIERSAADDMPTAPLATTRPVSGPPPLKKSTAATTTPPTNAARPLPEKPQGRSSVPWVIAIFAVAISGWALLSRPKASPEAALPPPEPAETAVPATEQPIPQPTLAEPETPPPAAVSAEPVLVAPAVSPPAPVATSAPVKAPSEAQPQPQKPASTGQAKPAAAPAPTAAQPAASAPAAAAPSAAPAATETAEAVSLAGPFDKSAAAAALASAAAEASSCRKEGDPTGRAQVRVTFAPSGRAVHALVEGPPFAGTATGGCIAAVMRKARIPPFSGDRITVGKSVSIQ